MKCLKIIIINLLNSFFISFVTASLPFPNSIRNNNNNKDSDYLKLKNYLIDSYDTAVRPVINPKDKTEVVLIPYFETAEFDAYSGSLVTLCWLWTHWKDEFLTWDPNEFSQMENITIYSSEIWTPNIKIENSASESISLASLKCSLSHEGGVDCVSTFETTVKCTGERSLWPYEVYNCSIEFVSAYHADNEILFSKNHANLSIECKPKLNNWIVEGPVVNFIDKKSKFQFFDNFSIMQINYSLRKIRDHFNNIYNCTTFVLIILNLLTMWLHPNSTERLTLACVNFICHLLSIQEIHWRLPLTGPSPPNIFLFYGHSIFMSTLALLSTCYLKYLSSLETPVPSWVSSTFSFLNSTKFGKIIFSLSFTEQRGSTSLNFGNQTDDDSHLIDNNSSTQTITWNYVVNCLNWILFFSFFFLYMIFFIAYPPLT